MLLILLDKQPTQYKYLNIHPSTSQLILKDANIVFKNNNKYNNIIISIII